jgi:Ca2+-binding EF-hand superfamily protein
MSLSRFLSAASLCVLLATAHAEDFEEEALYEADGAGNMQDAPTKEQLRYLHTRCDADMDGKASVEEMTSCIVEASRALAKKDSESFLEEVDTSGDGKLSLSEHLEEAEAQLAEADREDHAELEDRRQLESAKHAAADTNEDGVLDADEIPSLYYPELSAAVLQVTVEASMRQKDTDGDGLLSPQEFWETADSVDGEEVELSSEEKADFEKLDQDEDGLLDLEELMHWETGSHHTQEALKQVFGHADLDEDEHLTSDELANASELFASCDSHIHILQWLSGLEQ